MTAQDFLNWMTKVQITKAADVVRILHVGRNQAQKWVKDAEAGQDVEISDTVALAMSARANGLKQWGSA